MSLPIGPTVSMCSGSIGYTPRNETKPWVVFNPTIPQQAAGTRIDPAVSVPKATSAIPLCTATALPDEEPPGIRFRNLLIRFFGIPKYSFIPVTPTANSSRLVLPTTTTPFSPAIAIQAVSLGAGTPFFSKYEDPAVVTTPLRSIRSFTAKRSSVDPFADGQ